MNVYRNKPIPVIYTKLKFVRESARCCFRDAPEDVMFLKKVQNIAAGHACISTLEASYQFIIKAELPDNILEYTGITGDAITWKMYHWKLWDVESLITEIEPAEAVQLENAGINSCHLESLAHAASCLPFLREAERLFNTNNQQGYALRSETASQLSQKEKSLIADIKLKKMKEFSPPFDPISMKQPNYSTISSKSREKILCRDNNRCLFCGQDASESPLEVDHIIPRSLINKLDMDPSLHTAPVNLCSVCIKCNRKKKDHLTQEDISFYSETFSDPQHPNYYILGYLLKWVCTLLNQPHGVACGYGGAKTPCCRHRLS